jgi:hypothetical protein
MTIGGIDCGARQSPAVDNPTRWLSAGISMAGDVTVTDFNKKVQDIPIHFEQMTQTVKDNLKAALMDTAKPFGAVSVTPDVGDDLGIGASGATTLIFISYQATYLVGVLWNVDIVLRKYT